MMDFKRILITRTDRLGDVVLSTPIIRYMRQKYPDAYIAFMTRPENYGVVMNNPHLDEVIIYDKYNRHKTLWPTVLFSFSLRKKRFDLAVALHPTNRDHIILFLAGIPERIGYNRKIGWLLTRRIPHVKQEGSMHEVDYNFDLLNKAGFDVTGANRRPYIVTSAKDKRQIDSILKDHNMLGLDSLIAVHAGASCPSKMWPAERFAQLIDGLNDEYSFSFILVGGNETMNISSSISSMTKSKVADLTGKLSVSELAELFSRIRLLISNDSGPVHVAAAMGAPVIVIFGRKDPGLAPKRWGPLGKEDVVLHKDVGCEICLAHNCEKHFACLEAITASEVCEIAGRFFAKKL